MNCEEARKALWERSSDPALRTHLLKCEACASEARLLDALASCERASFSPPLELSAAVKRAAREKAKGFRVRKVVFRMAAGFAVAAAIALPSVPAMLRFEETSQPKQVQSAAASKVAWDSVGLSEGLLKLSDEIESSVAGLSSSRESKDSRPNGGDADLQLQSLNLNVPDLLT